MMSPFNSFGAFKPFGESHNSKTWYCLTEFYEKYGLENIDEYLNVENSHVETALMFYDYFNSYTAKNSALKGLSCLALDSKSEEHETLSFFYGSSENFYKKFSMIRSKNCQLFSRQDMEFLLRASYRGYCALGLSYLNGFAWLYPDDEHYTHIFLHHSFKIEDIFYERPFVRIAHIHHNFGSIEEAFGSTDPKLWGKEVKLKSK